MRPGMFFRVGDCFCKAVKGYGCKGCIGDQNDMCEMLPLCSKEHAGVDLIFLEPTTEELRLINDRSIDLPDLAYELVGVGVMLEED